MSKLFWQLSPARRRAITPLMALMLAGALAEVVTIGAIVPFLAIIADPAGFAVPSVLAPVLNALPMSKPGHAVYVVAGLFAIAALTAAALRLLLVWFSQSFVNGVSYELAVRLYADALHQPYAYHMQHNSSEVIAAINKVQLVTNSVFMPMMQGTIALIIAVFIVAALVAIDPEVALSTGFGFALIYLATMAATRKRLRRNSGIISRAQDQRVKTMREGLGGIRDVLLDRSQPMFIETYDRAEASLREALTKNAFLARAPRSIVEAAGLVLITALAVVVAGRPGGLLVAIPVLGALALGAQKLLPLIQQIYAGWAQALGNQQVVMDIATLLDRSEPETAEASAPLPFENFVSLHNVGYAYGRDRSPALTGVSFEIPKGARVGIAGRTGSGKSTLMDLVLGLLVQEEGEIRIDGIVLTAKNRAAWQRNIAHVPQFIYLADATIAENIAFGVRPDAIDFERVRRAAVQAELAEVIGALPKGYDMRVGERGIQLSGGQRQRIGIARALYKQANMLVFDEATSSLDTDTENAVMESISRLGRDLTILIIAHRLSTLSGCDIIIRLQEGRLKVVETRGEHHTERQRALP